MAAVNQVRDWMTFKPVAVREEGAALEALDLMVEQGIRHLPVVDAGNHVIGVLSIDDLRAGFPFDVSWERPIDPPDRDQVRGLCVSDVMMWAPFTVKPDATLRARGAHAVRSSDRMPSRRRCAASAGGDPLGDRRAARARRAAAIAVTCPVPRAEKTPRA